MDYEDYRRKAEVEVLERQRDSIPLKFCHGRAGASFFSFDTVKPPILP
ncbi:hypothetical protein Patl1_05471 [Pistacia atlantica]|uniref:Uncharacterized protein n=1 Tax=Pistacia atlantica TaxID=434234 RepID=A0ACC1BU97_9ROSI|nr:hypothetical protein Patl1_05471 [Pistacia atlantica]